MKRISLSIVVAVLALGTSCNRDPKIVAQHYVQSGNRYFDAGKYKEASIMYRKALIKNKLSGDAWFRLAQSEMRLQHIWPETVQALQYAVSLDSGNLKARVQLNDLYLLSYMFASPQKKTEAAALMDGLIGTAKGESPEKHRMLGSQALYVGRDFKKAIAEYEAALKGSPLNPEIVFPLAQALILDGRKDEGEKLAKASLEKNTNFEPLYDILADLYLRTNRVAEAEAMLKLRVANNPKSGDALMAQAMFYRGTNRLPEMNAALDKLVSDTAAFPDARLKVSQRLIDLRDYEAAIRYLEPGIRSDPKRKPEYQKKIARAMLAMGKKAEAENLIADVVKEKPEDAEARAMQAGLLIGTDPDKAAAELQEAVSKGATDAATRLNLARALMAKKRPDLDQARRQLEMAMSTQGANATAIKAGMAELLLKKGDFTGALAAAKQVLEVSPQNAGAKLVKSAALAGSGNVAEARAESMQILRQNPQSAGAMLQLAALNLREKKYAEAEELLAKVHEAVPGDAAVTVGLAQAYWLEGDRSKAIRFLQTEARNQPAIEAKLLLAAGEAALGTRDLGTAIAMFREVSAKDPENAGGWFGLGRALRAKGDRNGAMECLRKASRIQPANPAVATEIGVLLQDSGQIAEARKVYEDVLKTQPDDFIVLNNAAYIIAETGTDPGDLDRALNLAKRARQKRPDSPDVADTLGWIYTRKKLNGPALDIYRELIPKQPENPMFRYHFAMALWQDGKAVQARKELESALRLKPAKKDEDDIRKLMAKVG